MSRGAPQAISGFASRYFGSIGGKLADPADWKRFCPRRPRNALATLRTTSNSSNAINTESIEAFCRLVRDKFDKGDIEGGPAKRDHMNRFLIPGLSDQNPWAQSHNPIDVMRQG